MVSPERLAANRIRSFVMRAGRMTPSQQRGWEEGFPQLGLAVDAVHHRAGLQKVVRTLQLRSADARRRHQSLAA